jgi:hypothetical protein
MNNELRDRGILDVIRVLSARGASGRLHVSTGMTDGALLFNRGRLVDVRVGRLNGFQAINALAGVPDATYNFDPSVQTPAQSSIAPKERVLLKDFFGIEAAEREVADEVPASWPDEDAEPEQVVPLSEVPDPVIATPLDDEATLIRTKPSGAEPRPHVSTAPNVSTAPAPAFLDQPRARSAFRPASSALRAALLLTLLVLVAGAAGALIYQFRKPDSTASTVPAVQTPSAEVAQPPSTSETASAVPDLTGNWNVVNTVEQTSYGAYKNMRIGFNVSIDQTGKDFTGTGQKISENGRTLPADSRTPIVVKGTIDGDKVEATFSESGAVRKTNGRFVWRIDKTSGGLTGTFVSNAARSSGKSAATKEL